MLVQAYWELSCTDQKAVFSIDTVPKLMLRIEKGIELGQIDRYRKRDKKSYTSGFK